MGVIKWCESRSQVLESSVRGHVEVCWPWLASLKGESESCVCTKADVCMQFQGLETLPPPRNLMPVTKDLPTYDGAGLRIGIVSARWNSVVCAGV